ncbi:hypothetical protein BASA81_005329 [Batrachochytrium salamandrivorans]|nr:hypothetical protein BASA81_005329 [Batrachochytrium salamandrivorans]
MQVPKSGKLADSRHTAGRDQPVPLWKLDYSGLKLVEDDLIMLEQVNDGSIIYNLRKHYEKQGLYTWVGASHRVLVSINPYQRLPIYGDDQIKVHQEKSPNIDVAPHIFDIAEGSYTEMLFEGKHQSILISGESGAGKTEATKQCLKFWAKVAGSKNGVEERLIQANPVLEAFGNAKTIRNNNSSRFGKWMEVYFSLKERSIDGATITPFLLEKSRLVFQQAGERNFHIFYQLVNDAQAKSQYELESLDKNRYTLKGITGKINGIDDAADFTDAKKAMADLSFAENEQEWLLRLPSAILHLGNVTFVPEAMANGVSGSKIADDKPLALAAKFLDVTAEALRKVLLTRTIVVRSDTNVIPLDPEAARAGCDSIAKGIYSRQFDWLVGRCNKSLVGDTSGKFVGVLDIFGFEIFDVNSFEQLCINYCNEKLQQLFNIETFRDEEKLYVAEGIKFDPIKFIDSDPVLAMIELGPLGILPALDDECKLPEGLDSKFMAKIEQSFASHPNFGTDKHRKLTNTLAFEIVHYAGSVNYTCDEFSAKNKDTFFQDAYDLGATSSNALTKGLFPPLDLRLQTKSLSSVFREQLKVLMVKLNTTSTRYVRCIKPNESMAPLLFESPLVMRQLRYSGVFEAVAIRKQGFPFRYKYEVFCLRFKSINPDHQYKKTSPKEIAQEIIDASPAMQKFKSEISFGNTMVLYRAPVYKMLKLLRNLALEVIIPRVQGILRGSMARQMRKLMAKAEGVLKTALDTKTDIEAMKKALTTIEGNLGSVGKRLFPKLRPRYESDLKTQIPLLQLWLDEEVKVDKVLALDPNKHFKTFVDQKKSCELLAYIPKTSFQTEKFNKMVSLLENCEVQKLDSQCTKARKDMDRDAMEVCVGKAKEWDHSSPAVDELKRVLALGEYDWVALEVIAAEAAGDSARLLACKLKIWALDGNDDKVAKARREMNKDDMQTWLSKANAVPHSTEGTQELARVLKLDEKSYLELELVAAQEMGDKKRERKVNGRLFEIEMNALPSSPYAKWENFKGIKSGDDYVKGKWFGKQTAKDAMLVSEKGVINSSLSQVEDPQFKKTAKDMHKAVLAYCGLKPDSRGESGLADAFAQASRDETVRKELLLQCWKQSMADPKGKVDSGANKKALDLAAAIVYTWRFQDDELNKFAYVSMVKKGGKKYGLACAHAKFDSDGKAPRGYADIDRIAKALDALEAENAQLALQ